MKEDKFIITHVNENTSCIFPNFKNPIKYISLNETCTLNFDENFNLPFFTRTNRNGLFIKYKNEDNSFQIWGAKSAVNVNLNLKYFKIGF